MDETTVAMPGDLYLGHAAIDAQHEILYYYYHEMVYAVDCKDKAFVLSNILSGLNVYIATHFRYEEELMSETGYPEGVAHEAEHKALSEGVARLGERFYNSAEQVQEDRLVLEIAEFLKSWLKHHIVEVDRRLAEYLAAKQTS
ncbi:MAG: bacteriohemerythrin [Magnetococcus sp. MYC-9]